ncbi:MAG: hypothetical protein KBD78_02945 [Oligoflexales bacterium]|nr:hypothetical protein [Oligoflexales bacterium]
MAILEKNIARNLPRLGWINYWNLLPFYQELKRKIPKLDLVKGHPVEINRMLINGDLDFAPSSSICLADKYKLTMATPLGVSATGKVDSVYLGFSKQQALLYQYYCARNTELANILKSSMSDIDFNCLELANLIFKSAKIPSKLKAPERHSFILSSASAASVGLTKLFYQLWLGATLPLIDAQNDARNPIELLIGDLALQKRSNYEYCIDLSEAWFELTKLPFVFSVWQGKTTMPDDFKKQLTLAAEAAQYNMHNHPESYFPVNFPQNEQGLEIDLASYWQKIEYKLTASHQKGLELYLFLIKRLENSAI